MSDIALRFLFANLAAACAIATILILRKPVRAAFGARIAYALWLLAPLAAIGSLLPPRIVEIIQPAPAAAVVDPASFPSQVPLQRQAPLSSQALLSVEPLPEVAPIATPSTTVDPWMIATLLWLAGGIAMFAWQLRNQSRFMADARAGFAGPAVAGFLRPRIITPSDFTDRFDRDEQQIIIAHETIHLRRNDARVNALVALLRCVCWFNPLIHLAAHLMRVDQELACDASVVENHPRAKAVYASALLKAQLAARPLPLGCYWPAGADHPLTERVEMLKQAVPGRVRRHIGTATLALLTIGAGATAWAVLPPEEHLRFQPSEESGLAAIATASIAPAIADDPAPPAPSSQSKPQTPRSEPEQSPSPAPRSGSQELPPPPMQPLVLPVRETWAGTDSPPKLDAGSPLYLRGRIEKIEFSNTTYAVFLRATSIARSYPYTDGIPRPSTAHTNVDLWELSPTNYFGDRDSIRSDLMGKAIEINGLNLAPDCKPSCRIKVQNLILPRNSEVPQLRADESLINQFGYWYDTNARQMVRGKVERVEFSDRTFDAYIRSESLGVLPSRLYQARSEYRFPRADIERALLDKTVVVSGWRARDAINTFCDPICGLYANDFAFVDRSRLTPTGAVLVTPSAYLQRPRGQLFLAVADLSAPVTLSGKILRYVSDTWGENPQLWIEASSALPETTFGSKTGTIWVVAGFPFEPHENYGSTDSARELRSQTAEVTARIADLAKRYSPKHPEMMKAMEEKAALEARIADELWVGRNVTIRGFNVEDKRCQPQCMMAGDSITMRQ